MTNGTPDERLGVLLLMERLASGGAERRFLRLARGLPRDCFDLRIGVLNPGGELGATFAATGLPIVPFYRRWRYDLSPVGRIARYCRAERIAVIHAMHWLSGIDAALVARRVPAVAAVGSTVGHIYHSSRGGRLRWWGDRLTHGSLAAMMVNTVALRDYLSHNGYPVERVVVIPNGVAMPDLSDVDERRAAIRERWGIPLGAPCAGMLARLEPVKDHAAFVRAARLVVDRFPDARFVIAGDGAERDRLTALTAALGLTGSVIFTGTVDGADAVVPAWDVLAHPSHHEGSPNAVIEAMAWGKPVIATSVDGVPELILPGVTGVLVPIGDPPALAGAIEAVFADPDGARQMGRDARQHVEARWSVERMIGNYADMYRRVAKRPHAGEEVGE